MVTIRTYERVTVDDCKFVILEDLNEIWEAVVNGIIALAN
jgi:hypothetical protein